VTLFMVCIQFMGSVDAQNCEIPQVKIYYNFEGNRIGCESGPLKIVVNYKGLTLTHPKIKLGIPLSLNNAAYIDYGDFNILEPFSRTTAEAEVPADGYSDFDFTINVTNYNLGVVIPVLYSYSFDEGVTWIVCLGKSIIIPAFKQISGNVNLSDINKLPGDPLLPPSTSGINPQWIKINGTLNIDEDYTLGEFSIEQSSNIILEDDSKIVVNNNKTFRLRSTYLHGCNMLWDGVYSVEGGRLLAVRNKIEDSRNGLIVDNSVLGTQQIVANYFNNNGIGIQIPAAPLREVPNEFLGNSFTFEGQMLESVFPTYGMKIQRISNAVYTHEVNSNIAYQYRHANIFDSITYGIDQSGGGTLLLGRGNLFRNNIVGANGNRSNINIPSILNSSTVISSKNINLINWTNGDASIRYVETSFFEEDGSRYSGNNVSKTEKGSLEVVLIHDLKGALIKVLKNLNESTWRNNLNTDYSLEAGLYIVSLKYQDGSIVSHKVILQ